MVKIIIDTEAEEIVSFKGKIEYEESLQLIDIFNKLIEKMLGHVEKMKFVHDVELLQFMYGKVIGMEDITELNLEELYKEFLTKIE